ncbi:BatA and WFA domain-containing protein [Candidatus Woesearchaeota archaeon]|nr:BatA and WFA domain-containing protein [Candidatus Woesearchaeota archaeon]
MVLEILQGLAANHLAYQAGLWALLTLIPLILVYLIRPKPKKQVVPALMFLLKDRAQSDKKSFLRRFVRDPLFLFQVLILIAFALAIAKPFITVTEDVFVEKTAIVVDATASSQVTIDGESRFERAIGIAKEQLGTKNTIIAISSIPELIADDVDSAKAKDELDHIKPRDTPTNIFDSIIFAGNYVKEKDRVVVISDFIETSSQKDYLAAKSILESKGLIVDMINVREYEERKAKNIGITDVEVTDEQVSVQIKNYNDDNETVRLAVEGVNLTKEELTIEPKAVEVISYATPAGLSKFSIKPRTGSDDFELDNDAYVSSPSQTAVPLLLIANSVTKYLSTALDVIDTVTTEKGTPPKVPDPNHNIMIISNVNRDLILPGLMKKIKKQVEDGAALIVVAQTDILALDLMDMLPVDRADNSGPVLITEDTFVTPTQATSLTQDINFGRVQKYLKVVPKDDAVVLATTTNNVSMIVMRNYGKGMVLYFGLMDDYSTFKEDIYYPVFWKRVFDVAIKKQDMSSLNFKTGKLINLLQKTTVTAPYGKVTAETILLSHQGIYRTEDRNFVANLVDEDESDVNGEDIGKKQGIFDESMTAREKVPFDLTKYFIIGLLLAVFLELIWIKFRGDL